MKKNILFTLSGLLLTVNAAYSQCSIIGLNPVICTSDSPANLAATGPGTFSGPGIVGNTFDPMIAGVGTHTINYIEGAGYTIDQTGTYAPVASVGTSVSLGDDQVSVALPVGFDFNFFGTLYNTFYISSNGFISFDPAVSQGCCSGGVIPAADAVNNVIAWDWNDLYPPGGGSLTYETVGVAPNRSLLVTYTDVPHCCSTAPPINTGQIILYETTNIIEMHSATVTNDGSVNTQGIENATGTIGYATPGRNSIAWTATNDFVAFIPSIDCASSQVVVVNPSPTVVGSVSLNPGCMGATVVFTGSGADMYTWDNGATDGVPYTVTGPGLITVTGTEMVNGCTNTASIDFLTNPSPTITLSANDEMFGNDGSINLTILTGIVPFTFDWNNDGIYDDNNDLSGVAAGAYTVTMMDGTGCIVTLTATVGSQLGLTDLSGIEFSIQPNPSEGIFQIILATELNDENNSFEIMNSIGQKMMSNKISSQIIDVNISKYEAGVYYVKIISDKGLTIKPIIIK